MKTGDFGWVAFDYDAQRLEEIRLETFNTSHPAIEVWVSLDRPAERDERGRPTSRWQPAVDLEHFDIAVDLTEGGRDKDWMKGKFKVGVRLLPLRDGARAVQLYLDNFAKVTAVSEGGKPLPYPARSRRRPPRQPRRPALRRLADRPARPAPRQGGRAAARSRIRDGRPQLRGGAGLVSEHRRGRDHPPRHPHRPPRADHAQEVRGAGHGPPGRGERRGRRR